MVGSSCIDRENAHDTWHVRSSKFGSFERTWPLLLVGPAVRGPTAAPRRVCCASANRASERTLRASREATMMAKAKSEAVLALTPAPAPAPPKPRPIRSLSPFAATQRELVPAKFDMRSVSNDPNYSISGWVSPRGAAFPPRRAVTPPTMVSEARRELHFNESAYPISPSLKTSLMLSKFSGKKKRRSTPRGKSPTRPA